MFATFDDSNPPFVHVIFKGGIKNIQDFKSFTNKWLSLYEREQQFVFTFDTRGMALFIKPKWCFKMSSFIKKLKRETYSIYNIVLFLFAINIFNSY